MTLVHLHVAPVALAEEALLGVHVGLALDPGGRLEGMAAVFTPEVLPLNRERNGVLAWRA